METESRQTDGRKLTSDKNISYYFPYIFIKFSRRLGVPFSCQFMIKYIDEGVLHQAEEEYCSKTKGIRKIPVHFAGQEFIAHYFIAVHVLSLLNFL
jgi:hypothetical protein